MEAVYQEISGDVLQPQTFLFLFFSLSVLRVFPLEHFGPLLKLFPHFLVHYYAYAVNNIKTPSQPVIPLTP
jgi:hypothetical protein